MRRRTATRRSVPRVASALAVLALSAATTLVVGGAAPASAAGCSSRPKTTQVQTDLPWPLAMWDLEKLPKPPAGPPVIVAVLDSGVSDTHPQLSGQVLSGGDKLAGGDGQEDCVGHGTGVASLIAAKRIEGIPFHGIAQRAKILPIRISENIAGQQNPGARQASVPQIAEAVNEAVNRGASVINLSFTYHEDNDSLNALRSAIERAVRSGVVVVAAAGNGHRQDDPAQPFQPDPISYPAAWPGVLGVGAISQTGLRQERSQVGPYVDLVAPGEQITIAGTVSGYLRETGTSYAAPMVAATAALIMEYYPHLSAEQVIARLLATTDPATGSSDGYGIGVVNPIRAITEVVDGSDPLPAPVAAWPSPDPQQVDAAKRVAAVETRAGWIAGIGLLVAAVAVVLTISLPTAIRRRWRPAGR